MLNDRNHTVPAPTDQPSRAGLLTAFESVNDIVPVADVTARAAVAAAVVPSTSRPLFTYRTDAAPGSELEVTKDGSSWRTVLIQEDTGWITMGAGVLATGYSAYGGALRAGAYRKVNGEVSWRGVIKKSSAIGSTETLLTMPLGFRPAAMEPFNVLADGPVAAQARIDLYPTGVFSALTAGMTGSYVVLSGISYTADGS